MISVSAPSVAAFDLSAFRKDAAKLEHAPRMLRHSVSVTLEAYKSSLSPKMCWNCTYPLYVESIFALFV